MSGKSASILEMQQAIMRYIQNNIPKDPNKAHIGTVKDGRVIIGNSAYHYIPTVDMYFGNGDKVACLRPDNTNSAIVVGVM